MKWNYRVAKQLTGLFDIVEVYYNAEGKAYAWCPAGVSEYEDKEDLKSLLELMLKAFDKPTIQVLENDSLAEQTP